MKKQALLTLTILSLTSCSISSYSSSLIANIEKVSNEYVEAYFKGEKYDYSDTAAEVNATTDLGDNLPIHLSWEIFNNKKEINECNLLIKEDNKTIYDGVIKEKELDFYNYKLGSTYYFEVSTSYSDIVTSSEVTIDEGYLRTIHVDGVTNFRDLGSYGHIKQGLIYRSATLENNTVYNPAKSISEAGIREFKSLGIKSEIDLRKADERGMETSPVEGVKYLFAPLYYGGNNILTYNKGEYNNPLQFKNIFDFLADESNYPVDFHCVRGTDRTGCLAFVIEGLMGVEEEYLKRDYIFSNFYNIGSPVRLENIENTMSPSATAKTYVNSLKLEEGNTLQEKIYNYLLSEKIGVSKENLDKVISILKA